MDHVNSVRAKGHGPKRAAVHLRLNEDGLAVIFIFIYLRGLCLLVFVFNKVCEGDKSCLNVSWRVSGDQIS